jgi:deazaflavin-dependent oxidoreductase (nitroreductase family)
MSENNPPPVNAAVDLNLLGEAHVRAYRETNGETGYIWNGAPILLLTTKGRKSGEARTIPIIFSRYGEAYVIMGSKGGSPVHPKWYLNILDDPHVELQVKADKFAATARTAQSPEREKIWAEALKTWPRYAEYQSRTERQIPVVVIERKPA